MDYKKILDYNILNLLESKTNIKKHLWIYSFSGICLYLVMGLSLVANFIGFVYPAYMSFKSMQTNQTEDDIQWLMYWIVYSLFSFMESLFHILLSCVPFYHQIKLVFLLWLAYEHTRGAEYLYNKYVKDYLILNETKIDNLISTTKDSLISNVENITDGLIPHVENITDNIINSNLKDTSSVLEKDQHKTE